jgi:hypothetical protein
MALTDFVAEIARDTDPARAGYQASAVYVTLCLVVPIALGLVGALLGYVLEKLRSHGKKETR